MMGIPEKGERKYHTSWILENFRENLLGNTEDRNVGDRKPENFGENCWGNPWRKKCGVYPCVLNTM